MDQGQPKAGRKMLEPDSKQAEVCERKEILRFGILCFRFWEEVLLQQEALDRVLERLV